MPHAPLGAARRAVRVSLVALSLLTPACSTTDSSAPLDPPPPPPRRSAAHASSDSAPRVESIPSEESDDSVAAPPVPSAAAPTSARSIERSSSAPSSALDRDVSPSLSGKLGALKGVQLDSATGAGGLGTRGAGSGGAGTAGGTVGGVFGGVLGGKGYGSGEGALGSAGIPVSGLGRGAAYGAAQGSAGGGAAVGALGNKADVGGAAPAPQAGGTFVHAGTNPIVAVAEDPLSTFAVDVDTGSYFYARRFLELGRAPHAGSVRVEEWVNALGYAYAPPDNHADRFAIHMDAAPSPFSKGLTLVRVALKGKVIADHERKPAHIVFLVDVSGSMSSGDKLEWAKESMEVALSALRDDDTVAIATYAGNTAVVLPTTSARDKARIRAAIRTLHSGGGTHMSSGMELAYREATKELSSNRSARVFVLSDGDANIGNVSHDEILKSIRGYVSEGVTMSTVGYGTGNYNDHLMEQLADAGNGTYTYISSKDIMRRVFKDELTSTLEMIAQDVKIQVEWNPAAVESYRLLGYENRDVADQDFRNDKKDAGEIGAGHAVTALYEVRLVEASDADELATVRVRAKAPRTTRAVETARTLTRGQLETSTDALDADAKAALGAALAAEVLRGSAHAEGLSLADAARLLRAAAHGPFAREREELAALLDKVPSSSVAAR